MVQLTDDTGNVKKEYVYDAFGNEKDIDADDNNAFRYCGEYFDKETGTIYLRARYYDPSVGRFGSEDPAEDGLNWYIYAYNNPVAFHDPTGQFGRNTQLSNRLKGQNSDVAILQQKLASLGYMSKPGKKEMGYFGSKTLAAVNRYKSDNGLWNFKQYKGVVGITTWEHMGLKANHDYESGSHMGDSKLYGRGVYLEADKGNLKRGITLGEVQAGVGKIGGDYKYGSWELQAVTADAGAGLSANYQGYNLEGRLLKLEGGVKIPLPNTQKKLFLGVDGSMGAFGVRSYYNIKKNIVKKGKTNFFGYGYSLGIID